MNDQPDNPRWRFLDEVFDGLDVTLIVEVGIERVNDETYRLGDGHATHWFYRYLQNHPACRYVGIDADPAAVTLCRELFPHPNMTFLQGDAEEILNKSGFHAARGVLYLDAGDDPTATMRQYFACGIGLRTVLVDDTFQRSLEDYPVMPFYWIGKGAALVPCLSAAGWEWKNAQWDATHGIVALFYP